MKVVINFGDWKPREVIKSKIEEIKKAGKYGALESYLEDIYGDQEIDGDTLEQIILYDFDTICDALGFEPWGDSEIEESYNFKSDLLRSISERVDKMVSALHEDKEEDVFEALIQVADDEGLNVVDLIEYESIDLAERVSDMLGMEVSPEEIEIILEQEKEDMQNLEEC